MKLKTKARPYLVKWPVCGGQAVYTYNTRDEAVYQVADKVRKGIRVQMYKLEMPTELEISLQSL